jgi:hypothetical protein
MHACFHAQVSVSIVGEGRAEMIFCSEDHQRDFIEAAATPMDHQVQLPKQMVWDFKHTREETRLV